MLYHKAKSSSVSKSGIFSYYNQSIYQYVQDQRFYENYIISQNVVSHWQKIKSKLLF